ncbi:hypothetical protein K4L44_09320 [Halosquirtibacter laminarini]|uniref:Uncharacterized protein n=1 Tax=Halosquirtibacter laminarini TaxID=3374600 RepID=A0AC61NJR9_9BACT|nr:hypothetical protein K4L44_09320 [Prolixibacteraceae bacterium]
MYYRHNQPKKWEVWGATSPNPDGSFDSWTKLLDCESIKPSGDGPVTNEDREYINRGEDFEFPLDAPSVRYIRIVMSENWSGGVYAQWGELTFWGQVVEQQN